VTNAASSAPSWRRASTLRSHSNASRRLQVVEDLPDALGSGRLYDVVNWHKTCRGI